MESPAGFMSDNGSPAVPHVVQRPVASEGGSSSSSSFLQLPRSQSSRLKGKRCSEVLTMEKIRELELEMNLKGGDDPSSSASGSPDKNKTKAGGENLLLSRNSGASPPA